MKRTHACTAVFAALVLSTPSGAALLEVDLATAGDGLLTRDTSSGLDWLDLTLTLDRSYDDVIGDIGVGLPAGFRYASQSEVIALFAAAGVPVPTITNFAAYTNAIDVMALLGCTGALCGTSTEFVTGTMDFDVFDPLNANTLQILVNHIQLNVNATLLGSVAKNSAVGESGNFLVRAVPEPGTALLLGPGLAMLTRIRSRRSRGNSP